jgi:adenylate cyclase
VIVAGAGLLTWRAVPGRHAVDSLAGKTRIVVLPFENLTQDRADDWLASAFSDSLTAGLQDVESLLCVSRDRVVETYRQQRTREGSAVDASFLRQISERLGVRYYVRGSYQRLGDEIKVVVQLIDTADSAIRAQESVTERFASLLKVEDDLGRRLAAQFEAGNRTPAPRVETSSLDAHQAFVEGRNAYAASSLDRASDRLRRAVQLDPRFAEAWALLSKTNARLAADSAFGAGSFGEFRNAALSAARRATELDPSNYDAHTAQALAYRVSGELDKWRAEAQRAIAANPRVAEGYELIADSYAAMPAYGCKRDRNQTLADQYFTTALEIEPSFGAAYANFTYHLYWSARTEQAVDLADRGLRVLPNHAGIMRAKSAALMRLARADAAEQQIEAIAAAGQNLNAQDHYVLGGVALIRGDAERAKKEFDVALTLLPTATFPLAIARAYLDNRRLEEGLRFLDRAVSLEPACAQFAATSPAFAPYRDTPQFRARLATWK